MPVKPEFTWEQTEEEVLLHVTIKGFKKESVDVFITDAFVKINAAPTYLLLLDLLHAIDAEKSSYHAEKIDHGCLIHIKLRKAEEHVVWEALCINKDIGKSAILTRRAAAIERAEAAYNARLISRSSQREAEQRRLTEEQWEVEKQQRALIERRMKEEKSVAEADLFTWEQSQKKKKKIVHGNDSGKNGDNQYSVQSAKMKEAITGNANQEKEENDDDDDVRKAPHSPADIAALHLKSSISATSHIDQNALTTKHLLSSESTHKDRVDKASHAIIVEKDNVENTQSATSRNSTIPQETPHVRGAGTVCVAIDFTPKLLTMPSRSRGDEEYYRKSKYKPVSIEDSPMFWKERGDAHYKAHNWKDAANAYSESIKRDGVFLTCVMNRAACYLHMMELKRAIEDCTLSLTLLGNTPASEITQDRYRYLMAKLHARRGAAYGWKEEYTNALTDLRVALAYTNAEREADEYAKLTEDINNITHKMKEKGLSDAPMAMSDPFAPVMQTASGLYYQGKFDEALREYEKILSEEPYHVNARSNYITTLLHCSRFNDALTECKKQIAFCGEVASALNEPGGLSNIDVTDSDDEDEEQQHEYEEYINDSNEDRYNNNSIKGKSTENVLQSNSSEKIAQSSDKENGAETSLLQEIRSITRSGREQWEEQEQEQWKESDDHIRKMNNTDDAVKRRKAAAKLIAERSTHVYVLLKAYVRAAAALCGLNDFRQAHEYLQNALRITPYDNDLLDDCNRIAEKVRMNTLVAASTAQV